MDPPVSQPAPPNSLSPRSIPGPSSELDRRQVYRSMRERSSRNRVSPFKLGICGKCGGRPFHVAKKPIDRPLLNHRHYARCGRVEMIDRAASLNAG